MTSKEDRNYYDRRAAQEFEAAETEDPAARCIHLDLARRYAALSGATERRQEWARRLTEMSPAAAKREHATQS